MKKETYKNKYMSMGMCMGMSLGTAFGAIIGIFTNIIAIMPFFTFIGILVGMATGAFIGKSKDDNNKGE